MPSKARDTDGPLTALEEAYARRSVDTSPSDEFLQKEALRLAGFEGETLRVDQLLTMLAEEYKAGLCTWRASGIVSRSRRRALSRRSFAMDDLQGAYAALINAHSCSREDPLQEEPAYLLRRAMRALEARDGGKARGLIADALMLVVSDTPTGANDDRIQGRSTTQ